MLYLNGLGIKQDYSEAMEYYLQSVEKGNSNTIIKIEYLIVKIFLITYLKKKKLNESQIAQKLLQNF